MTLLALGSPKSWLARRILLSYVILAALFLASGGLLKVLKAGQLADHVTAVAPQPNASASEVNKAKIREAMTKLPSILAKLGIALLGVAAIGRLVRAIEPDEQPEPIEGQGGVRAFSVVDWLVPVALGGLVLAQVVGSINRPLRGDELENYQQHLTIPFTGMMTTMGGANNQLGFSILAWPCLRIFGDSPSSVRLPALLGAMLLPVVAYRSGMARFGRPGAMAVGLLVALWPDCVMAGMQGRSYSLLMVVGLIHVNVFQKFAMTGDRRSGLAFAVTMAAACTLHLWFVIVAGAELVFLAAIKLDDRLRGRLIGLRVPLRIETFLVFLTLGGLVTATVQAGILPKFAFVLTQKGTAASDGLAVFSSMAECLEGRAFDNDGIDPAYREIAGKDAARAVVAMAALAGFLACVVASRRDPTARFMVTYDLAVALTFFLVVTVEKPVYLYARFFVVLPMMMAWSAAMGWGAILSKRPARNPVAVPVRGKTVPA